MEPLQSFRKLRQTQGTCTDGKRGKKARQVQVKVRFSLRLVSDQNVFVPAVFQVIWTSHSSFLMEGDNPNKQATHEDKWGLSSVITRYLRGSCTCL